MSVSVFEHPFLSGLLGDEPLTALFSVSADIAAMLRFEAALAVAEEAAGVIPSGSAATIAAACDRFKPDLTAIREATRRDGVCVPELVRQLRETLDDKTAPHLHFGATSQDVIDTSLVLRLQPAFVDLQDRLDGLIGAINAVDGRFGQQTVMAHTRMQQAIAMRVSDKLANWRAPLQALAGDLDHLKPGLLRLQFGGAVGTRDKLGDQGAVVSATLAKALELADDGCWHTDRTALVAFADWLSRVTGVLGKIGQDIALMAQNELAEITLSGGGGSSAMAHKQNPVAAEILVTLARFNASLVSGMHNALVHENERSGAAWTLEWMVLPQMVVASGAALATGTRLIGQIENLGSADTGGGGS
ncbi:MAG: 3-carboxy-cis,cis-muconate cycloisomerase [Pseudomonadota bacterium]